MGLTLSDDVEEKARAHKKEIEELLIRHPFPSHQRRGPVAGHQREIEPLAVASARRQGLLRRPQIPGGPQGELVAGGASGLGHRRREAPQQARAGVLDSDELRSMSDKALGALRVAVAHDEALRDALRLSEGNRNTEQKVAFYVQVYRYLGSHPQRHHPLGRSGGRPSRRWNRAGPSGRRAQAAETHLSLSSPRGGGQDHQHHPPRAEPHPGIEPGPAEHRLRPGARGALNVNIREAHTRLLTALADQSAMHNDLFADKELPASPRRWPKLFQRLNPQIGAGDATTR